MNYELSREFSRLYPSDTAQLLVIFEVATVYAYE